MQTRIIFIQYFSNRNTDTQNTSDIIMTKEIQM